MTKHQMECWQATDRRALLREEDTLPGYVVSNGSVAAPLVGGQGRGGGKVEKRL